MRDPLKYFGVTGLETHLMGPVSRVPLKFFGVLGPGYHLDILGFRGLICRRPGSQVPVLRYAY